MHDLHALRPYRPLLYALAAAGLVGVNGVFLYYAFVHPDVMTEAYRNPVSLAFIAEAFLLMFFAAWGIAKAGWERPGWRAFVVLSVLGSLAFSVPVFVLMRLKREAERVG